MKNILVTGGTGLLGSSLLRRLLRKGHKITLLVRDVSAIQGDGLGRLLAQEGEDAQAPCSSVEVAEGDVTTPRLGLSRTRFLALARDVDTVFHCAAVTDFGDRDVLMRTNVAGTKHVLGFVMAGRPKRYHHISSAYVAGRRTPGRDSDSSSGPHRFNNAYEETKYIGELLVKQHTATFGLQSTIYRPSIIVGSSRTGYTKTFRGMYTFARALYSISQCACGRPFRIFGDRDALINLVPLDYVADSIVTIAADRRSINKTLYITNPAPPTLAELNVHIADALGISPPEIVPLTEGLVLNPLERLYLSYTRPYLPYVHSRARFDSTSTQELLAGTGVACPRITRRLISLLVRFAMENNWGCRTKGQEPILAGVS